MRFMSGALLARPRRKFCPLLRIAARMQEIRSEEETRGEEIETSPSRGPPNPVVQTFFLNNDPARFPRNDFQCTGI